MTNHVSAGWYPDPRDQSQRRYWDGTAWTQHVEAVMAPPPAAPAPTAPMPVTAWAPPPSPAPREWWRKPWVLATGGAVAIVVLVAALSNNGEDAAPAAADAQPTVTVTVAPTQAAPASSDAAAPVPSATVEATPAAVTSAPPAETPTAPATQAAPNAVRGGSAHSWLMPDEVGKDLQAAQDHIQGVTNDPFFFTDSSDATGADRFQILDVDWTVCGQEPAAGTTFGENTNITFYVVKDDETCP